MVSVPLSGCLTHVYDNGSVRQEHTTVGELVGLTFTKTRVRNLETFDVGIQFGLWAPFGVYEVYLPVNEAAIQHNAQVQIDQVLGR
ncbi:hypothetical protein D3C86_1553580 [compost metagenome]